LLTASILIADISAPRFTGCGCAPSRDAVAEVDERALCEGTIGSATQPANRRGHDNTKVA
jgi:hypothetical protein